VGNPIVDDRIQSLADKWLPSAALGDCCATAPRCSPRLILHLAFEAAGRRLAAQPFTFAVADPHGALAAYERAIELRADQADAYNNLGAALQALRRYPEGIAAFDTALRLKPNFPTARLNLSLSLLRAGRYEEGWREFEWRFQTPDYKLAPVPRPQWNGERLDGNTLLLRFEQGLGDTFQFIRFAPLVKERVGRVVVECQSALRHLIATCPGVDQVIARGEPMPKIDV
jgi:tetratricopeptide (TPR) repeat protein